MKTLIRLTDARAVLSLDSEDYDQTDRCPGCSQSSLTGVPAVLSLDSEEDSDQTDRCPGCSES